MILGTAAAVVTLLVAGTLVYAVLPPSRAPERADAVFVLGPAEPWRMTWAERLLAEGHARDLVVSVPHGYPAPDECSGGATHAAHVYCVVPDPSTTRGEARALKRLTAEHGWNRVTVITVTPHVLRAQARMNACVPHGVTVIGRPVDLTPGDWAWQFVYQTAGWIKLAVAPTC